MIGGDGRDVQRIIFPTEDVEAVLPLYLEDAGHPTDRTTCLIPAGTTLRLCTYFNAFPAAYWRHWAQATEVRLRVQLDGVGTCQVWRSDASTQASLVAESAGASADFSLPLDDSFGEGGLYWLEVTAADRDISLVEGAWSLEARDTAGTLSIGITTFNRPEYCLNQLLRIAGEPELMAALDTVYVVDQGTNLVSDQPRFPEASRALGSRLQLIRQPNLGGSGGFSRAMYETLRARRSRYVLLLDDDAIGEPEAILRSVRFADSVRSSGRRVLVGGAMFHLDQRSLLYVQGETINLSNGKGTPMPGMRHDYDLASEPLRNTTDLHKLQAADFNGWWMTLIPTEVLEEVGLGLPYFIKLDDIEFALRCARHGIATVCPLGVATWHQAWHNKFSWRTWEEYFTERNAWLTLITQSATPRAVPLRRFMVDVGMLLSLQYSSVAMRITARNEAAQGLGGLHAALGTRISQIPPMREPYTDADKHADPTDFPAVGTPSVSPRHSDDPRRIEPEIQTIGDMLVAGTTMVKHLIVPVPRKARLAPQTTLAASEAIWRQFARFDSALVEYPDGWVLLRRDQRLAWRLLLGSLRSIWALHRRWGRLHQQCNAEHATCVSPSAWARTFGLDEAAESLGPRGKAS